MFVKAIEEVARFTIAIHTIERSYGSTSIRPGAATMFFVNEEGVAVTCNHVAGLFPFSEKLLHAHNEFKSKKAALLKSGSYNKKVKELVQQYGFENNALCELYIRLTCVGKFDGIEVMTHPKYDLAIVRLINPQNLFYTFYARFLKYGTSMKQGISL